MTADLSKLTLDELLSLEARVKLAITERKSAQMNELKERLEAEAAKYGLTLADIMKLGSTSSKPEKKTGTVAPKYRNPNNPNETWTGRGRAPRWLVELEGDGSQREQFRI